MRATIVTRSLVCCLLVMNDCKPLILWTRPALAEAYADEVRPLAKALLAALRDKEQNQQQLYSLFQQHEDAAIFSSLPGTGKWLAPALLVKFGEDR